MELNFDNYLFHPSQMGRLMTDSRTKEQWGETAKEYLLECYVSHKYHRTKDFTNKYLEKGTLAEEDSIDLYSLVNKKFYAKNMDIIKNDFFIGTPDLYEGEGIYEAKVIIDLKTSWDIFTFFSSGFKKLNKNYIYQLQAYMDMTGASKAKLAYCLVNTPQHLIEDEKKKAFWRLGVIDSENDDRFQKACEVIEANGKYDDIPMEERIIEYSFERNQELIDLMHERIIEARKYLNQFNIYANN
jgi:hypothetical protein